MFLVSTLLRFRQYSAMLALVRGLPQRWPNLLRLLRQHSSIFLTWATLEPVVIVATLLLTNTLACQLVWPRADEFRVADLLDVWPLVPIVLANGLGMVAFDLWSTFRVGKIDQHKMEGYFDQAEHWLCSWQAPVVRVLSLGFINPRKMVAVEVRNALQSASELLNATLWWMTIQTTLRIAFGLTLWGSYALHGWLHHLLHGS
jgi:hypothetical protein